MPDPDPTGVAQRLEPALTGNLDPVQPAVLVPMRRPSGGDRAAATRLEELSQPFLNGLVIFAHPDDLPRVVDAENNHSTFGTGESQMARPTDEGFPKSTLESVADPTAGFDASQDFRCVHGSLPGWPAMFNRYGLCIVQGLPCVRQPLLSHSGSRSAR